MNFEYNLMYDMFVLGTSQYIFIIFFLASVHNKYLQRRLHNIMNCTNNRYLLYYANKLLLVISAVKFIKL